MQSIVRKAVRPFMVVLKGIILSLIICATSGAWAVAPTPTVVWDGDFSVLTQTVGNVTYTIGNVTGTGVSTASANSVGSDKSYLQIANSDNGVAAPIITATGGDSAFGNAADGATVLIFASGMPLTEGSNRALLLLMDNTGKYGKTTSGSTPTAYSRFGIARAKGNNYGGNAAGGFVKDGAINVTDDVPANLAAYTDGKQSIALTYKSSSGLKYYVDGSLKGEYNPNTDFTPTGVCIGGVDYTSSNWFYAQKQMKIHAIAIFNRELTAEEIAEYEAQSRFRYCDAIAWRNASNSAKEFHESTFASVGSIGEVANSTTRTYNTTGFPWQESFSTGKLPVALIYDQANKQQSVAANFSGLWIGGAYVNATPESGTYTITAGTGGTRETYLGDKTGNHESWFVFNESYTISRSGASNTANSLLYGTVNMYIAADKTFTLNSGASTSAQNLVMTAGTANTAAPVLRMSGSGKLVVPHLNASVGTLDFSGVTATPFIEGNLSVTKDTKLVLPSTLEEGAAYQICSGTLTAPPKTVKTTVQIGSGEAAMAYVTYNATDKTVSYSSSAPTYTGTVSGSTITWDSESELTNDDIGGANIVLTGSGEVTLGAEPITLSVGENVVVDITSVYTGSATLSGSGAFKFSSGYPSMVPAGLRFRYAGSNESENPASIAGVTVYGKLETSGYVNLTGFVLDSAAEYTVLSDTAAVSTTGRYLNGHVIVAEGATFSNGTTDAIDMNSATETIVDVYGTLAMNETRWTMQGNNTVRLYDNALVTGDGQKIPNRTDQYYGTLDLNGGQIIARGNATISARLRLRVDNGANIEVDAGKTLTLSGSASDDNYKGIAKSGAGTLKISAETTFSKKLNVSAGTLEFGASPTAQTCVLAAGTTLKFDSGCSLTLTGTGTPLTLPASGTANIDIDGITPDANGTMLINATGNGATLPDISSLRVVGQGALVVDGATLKVYPLVAKVNGIGYATLEAAEAAASSDSPIIEVYSGSLSSENYWTVGTVDGVTTYRKKNANLYYVSSKYWSSNTADVFALADGTTATANAGDTIIVDSKSSGDIWVDASSPANATNIKIARNCTFKPGVATAIFDGATITVADGATMTLQRSVRDMTLGALTLNVDSSGSGIGVVKMDNNDGTITFGGNISGTAAITIDSGKSVVASGRTVSNAFKGDGTIVYAGSVPTITLTDSDWTGTLWLKDIGSLSDGRAGESLTADMPNWGNSKSKVKFTNVKAYAHSQNLTCAYTLVLEDGTGSEEYAWRCDNGDQNNTLTVARLSGSGTFYDHSGPAATFTFNSFDGFTGKFDITSSGHQINVPDGAILTVAQNSSIKFTSQGMLGTLNIPANVTLTSTGGDAVSHNTGSSTVNVYGTLDFGTSRWTLGPDTTFNLYEGSTISGTGDGNAAMDFNVAGGSTIHAIGNATVSCTIRNNYANGTAKINVDEGKTLTFSGNLVGSYGLKKQGDGILKLTGSIEKLPTIDAGTVLLGGNKEWNLGTLRDLSGYTLEAGSSIAITQTKEEYGSGVTTMTGVDSGIASITVNKLDGTTTTITPTAGTGALEETAVVSGSTICNHDYEFDNAWTDTGSDKKDAQTWNSDIPNFLQDGETDNYFVYTSVRPGNTSSFGLSGDWSAAIRCTIPQTAKGVIVGFGTKNSYLALAAGETENTAMLVKGDTTSYTTLGSMSVAHATTAMHVYAFVKTDNAVDIYCDGNLITRYSGAIGNLTDGFQFGTLRGGFPSGCGLVESTIKSTSGMVDYMRIYNFAIDANMIAKLHNDHPYVSPSSVFSRTLAGESGLEWSATDAWTKGGETADAPDAEGIVELTATTDSSIAANLSTASLYETLTFKGAGAITVTKVANAATLSAVEVAVDTDTTVAADAVNFTVSRVAVAAGKTLMFDVSGIASANGNWANAASVDRIQLTGIATLGTGAAVAVTPATAGYWNLSAVEDGGYWYLSVAPGRATDSIYWQSGMYWNSTYTSTDSPAVFTTDAEGQTPTKYFAGDTVIIPTTTKRYFGPISDGAIIQFDCSGTIDISKTDSLGYALKNATVTVASGTTLNFVNSWNGASPEVYGGTISGEGKVQVASGITLTLSNGATIAAATALTGAGTVNFATVPTAQMTFDNWTGTVVLPAITSHVNLTLYGNSDSTIGITSFNTYLTSPYTEIGSTLRLDGAMTISAFSNRNYLFTKITGNGNLTFPNSNSPTSIKITELANYTGTLINNHESVDVAVTRVTKSVDVDGGALLLATNGVGEVSVSSFEVAGVAVSHYVAAGGFYRGAARYDGTVYKTFAEAINAVEEDGALLSDITVLDGSATVPDGYYIDNGVVAKCPAAIVYDVGDPDYYNTVQAAVNAANVKTYAGNPYEYVAVYANAAVTTAKTLKIKPMNGAVVTVSVPDITSEYALNDETDENGVVTYMIDPASTDYTWVTGSGDVWDTIAVAPWRYDVESTPTEATRVPGSVDSVAFASAADVTVGANVSVSSMTVSSAITLTKLTADVTVTATTGGIVLTDAGALITVSGVTLWPVPTTNVSHSRVKTVTVGSTTTYSVELIPGTIFSVY